MYTWAGPEIAVCDNRKHLRSDRVALYLLAMVTVRGKITDSEMQGYIEDLQKLPEQVELLLNNKNRIQKFANRYLAAREVFFIGEENRLCDFPWKISEIKRDFKHIHSEAYAAGELKHGTISLIEEGTLVTAILTQKSCTKSISNIIEMGQRSICSCH